jgi:GT2 family glycosyltransferase
MKPTYAALIVTRNRQADLEITLGSLASQEVDANIHLLIVDGSDETHAPATQRLVEEYSAGRAEYVRYPGVPSTARQRNFGFDRLPSDASVVFLFDDDVTLLPDYMQTLATALETKPNLGAVSGIHVNQEGHQLSSSHHLMWLRRLFLSDHPDPGRLLVSGCPSPAESRSMKQQTNVQWLSGCGMALRREVADTYRTDPRLSGYSQNEDLDFTYRISKKWSLAVDPSARLVHRTSDTNRMNRREYAAMQLVHRYWMVEKNIDHPLRKPAFWWSTFGRILVLAFSRNPASHSALVGLLNGIPKVFRRDHVLLARDEKPDARDSDRESMP